MKKFFLFLLSILILIVLGVVLIWFNLELILNSNSLEFLNKRYAKDLKVNWEDIDINIDSKGFFDKNLKLLTLKETCIDYKKSSICIEKLNLDLNLSFFKKRKLDIKMLEFISPRSKVFVSDFIDQSKSSGNKAPRSSAQQMLYSAKQYLLLLINNFPELVTIKVNDFTLNQEESVYIISTSLVDDKGKFLLKSKKLNIGSKYNIDRKVREFKELNLNTDLNLSSSKSNLEFKLTKDRFAALVLFESKSENKVRAQDIVVKAPIEGFYKISENESVFKFEVLEASSLPFVDAVSSFDCKFKLKDSSDESLNGGCSKVELKPSLAYIKSEFRAESLKDSPILNLNFDLKMNDLISAYEGGINIDIKDINSKWLVFRANTGFNFKFDSKKYQITPFLFKFNLSTKNFEKLISYLKSSRFAVPAPFNQFRGSVEVKSPDLKISKSKFIFPINVKTNLSSSSKSKMDLFAKGTFSLPRDKNKKMKLDLQVGVDEFRFYLPPLDPLKGVPSMLEDSRIVVAKRDSNTSKTNIKSSGKKESKESAIDYKIKVSSENSEAVRLYYKHFEPYFPLKTSALITNNGIRYNAFSPRKWDISYLKRSVRVDKLRINKLKKSSDYTSVEVRMVYEASGYEIFIDAIGSIDNPIVQLSSYPSLSREDIISVLLYNRTSDNLSSFENESVGGAQAAIADRAIGLIGLWAFASTPIESVSYNSRTNVYSATLDLPGGVKFDIGTDWEQVQNLSLRKRLNKYWVFVTSFEPGEDGAGLGNAFLQREWTY